MNECWKKNHRFHQWDWFIRTRLDLNFYSGVFSGISSKCIHTKLRGVSQLTEVTNSMLSYDYARNVCEFGRVDKPCVMIDDQFAIIPQRFAAQYFLFGNTTMSIHSHPKMCSNVLWAENQLTSYILHNKIPICPINHNASTVQWNFSLNREYFTYWSTKGNNSVKQCGKFPLTYANWIKYIGT
jgi:hypothetical protein